MDNQEPIQEPIFQHPLSGTGTTRDILGFINAFMISDTILLRTEMSNTDNTDNRGVSEVFSNNLDEFTVDLEFAKKEVQCSICLDDFKEGDKCIRLPCKGESHVFHSGSDSCSGVRPWLERNNTCPMCRHEFPIENQPLIPPSLAPTSYITLTPGQNAGLAYSNIDNVVPDMNDNNIIGEQTTETIPNPNSLENTISDMIEEYINEINVNIITTEDAELQRAIELSLNDIS